MTTNGNPKRILVVDDLSDLREMLAVQLEWAGYEVFQASDGKEGLVAAVRENVDLVITDKEMPGGDGLELLRRLKGADVQRPVVFVMTGSPEPIAELAHALGAEAVFAKPFPVTMLLESVSRFTEPLYTRLTALETRVLAAAKPLHLNLGRPTNAPCLIGRGGLFVPSPLVMPERHEKLEFTIDLPEVSHEPLQSLTRVEGIGIVRWVREATELARPPGFGLEFTSLTPEAARCLAKWSATHGIVAFIPNR